MPFRTLRDFIRLETSAGIILFVVTVLALVIDNSPLSHYYETFFATPIVVHVGLTKLAKPLFLWINDGLMAIFFLLVGLEVKREIIIGELNSFKKCILPSVAAIGGMAFPALIYVAFNWGDLRALNGWAIPTATDIAFSLGILAVLGSSRIPVALKMFLTALAIFDDIGAIIIIAVFYTHHVDLPLLLLAIVFTLSLVLLNRLKVRRLAPYVVVGVLLWLCVLKSGVHATLAGVVIAMAIPLRDVKNPHNSPLKKLERNLHPWVAYGVLPIFAFANAGVSFSGLGWQHILSPITLGIATGLFIGKQLGVWFPSWLSVKMGIAHRPRGTDNKQIYGVGLIAGVGFTMSLFIGSLAFSRFGAQYEAMVRIGVIAGSLASGVMGYLVLYLHSRKN